MIAQARLPVHTAAELCVALKNQTPERSGIVIEVDVKCEKSTRRINLSHNHLLFVKSPGSQVIHYEAFSRYFSIKTNRCSDDHNIDSFLLVPPFIIYHPSQFISLQLFLLAQHPRRTLTASSSIRDNYLFDIFIKSFSKINK